MDRNQIDGVEGKEMDLTVFRMCKYSELCKRLVKESEQPMQGLAGFCIGNWMYGEAHFGDRG